MNSNAGLFKYIKIFGRILAIVALFYVVRKIVSMDIPLKQVNTTKNYILMFFLVLFQTAILCTACIPWRIFIDMFSRKHIPYKKTMIVFLKANILKYLPGNVFHYVGRNELAIKVGVSHLSVAAATFFDIGVNVFVSMVLSLLFMKEIAWDYLSGNSNILIIVFGIILVILVIGLIIIIKLNIIERVKSYISDFSIKDLVLLFQAILYYVILTILGCVLFGIVYCIMLGQSADFQLLWYLCGAYILSMVVGFLTPGASGGIGIREGVMILLTDKICDGEMIALAMFIVRIISIFGDVLAYFIARINEKKEKKELFERDYDE